MSVFGVLELSYKGWQFEKTIGQIENYIDEHEELKQETKNQLREGINIIRQAKVYINRINNLIEDNDDEKVFHERLEEDLSNEYFYE